MPTGSLLELISLDAQDFYLTTNPQITYFKAVYRRHTNFSNQYIREEFTTTPAINTTNTTKVNYKVKRNGDLLYDTYLVFTLPTIFSDRLSNFQWIKNVGQQVLNSVEVTVGGQRIDKHYGQWLNIWNQLTLDRAKKTSYNQLIGNTPNLRPQIYHTEDTAVIPSTELYIPFDFWFCQNPGLAIPLIALQRVDVEFILEFNPINDLFTIGRNPALAPEAFFSRYSNNRNCNEDKEDNDFESLISPENEELFKRLTEEGWNAQNVFWRYQNAGDRSADCTWKAPLYLLLNYIFLDTEERRRFAQVTHEYLIPQLNRRLFCGLMGGNNVVELDLHHPTKEMIWVFQRQDVYETNDWFNYTVVNKADQYHETQRISYNNSFLLENVHDPHREFLDSVETNTFMNLVAFQQSDPAVPDDFLNIMTSGRLIFNGNDRFDDMGYKFFNALQTYKYHTHWGGAGIQVYSFSLDPENHHPSGTANFSAIRDIELFVKLKELRDEPDIEYDMFVYTVSYNVFRILGGIGALAFHSVG